MRPLSGRLSAGASSRYGFAFFVLLILLPGALALKSFAQVVDNQGSPDPQKVVAIENRLNQLTETLSQTEKMLDQSRAEIQALRSQLDALRAQTGAASPSAVPASTSEGYGHSQDLNAIREQQDAMQAEIKQHEIRGGIAQCARGLLAVTQPGHRIGLLYQRMPDRFTQLVVVFHKQYVHVGYLRATALILGNSGTFWTTKLVSTFSRLF